MDLRLRLTYTDIMADVKLMFHFFFRLVIWYYVSTVNIANFRGQFILRYCRGMLFFEKELWMFQKSLPFLINVFTALKGSQL